MRFQNFYKFSNQVRDEQTILDEKFVNPPIIYSPKKFTEDSNSTQPSETNISDDKIRIKHFPKDSSFPKKPPLLPFNGLQRTNMQKKMKFTTTQLFHTFMLNNKKWVPTVTLLNNEKLIMLRNKYEYKPLSVIDFSIFKTHIEATREMKKDYIFLIVVDEANYQLKVRVVGNRNYKKLLNYVKIRSSKHDPFI